MNSSINLPPAGLLLIDKPAGITSFDCIRALRRQTGVRKIGHAGTLDPMATGLMLLLVGSATKQAGRLTKLDKTYAATLTLGATSSTGDAEGDLSPVSDNIPAEAEVDAALSRFRGAITQTPPAHSAIKVAGVRAYKLARAGKSVTMPPRQVEIRSLVAEDYAYPTLRFRADVSSGTYIRSLAQDIGAALEVGAYLSALRRTKVGDYAIEEAHALEEVDAQSLQKYLMPVG
jgi:tRNA pseudouridine55 synthase